MPFPGEPGSGGSVGLAWPRSHGWQSAEGSYSRVPPQALMAPGSLGVLCVSLNKWWFDLALDRTYLGLGNKMKLLQKRRLRLLILKEKMNE